MTSGSEREDITRGRHLSWLLRHGASEVGLVMDGAGWASIDDVLRAASMTREQLVLAVQVDGKQRLQISGDRVRACQGHSRDNAAIDCDALEHSWQPHSGDASLWHGTSRDAIDGIATAGIHPVARTHVHLADDPESKVGKRAAVAWLLEVDPVRMRAGGHAIFVAPNGVVLTRVVPPGCIVGARAMTRRATAELGMVLRVLGLPRC